MDVGQLIVYLEGQASGLNSTLLKGEQDTESSARKMAASMARAGKTMTVGLTVPVAAGFVKMTSDGADLNETLSKTDVVFGNMSDSVNAWGKTTLENFGLARQTSLDMTSKYGDMATSIGFTQQAAADMGMEIVGRVADLSSFKNISTQIADTALTAVFTGETESLKALGIIMTQANLDAFALEKGFEKTTKQMSQQELVSLRLKYVMEKTNNAAGDFVRTQDSVANQSRITKESLKEISAELGMNLQPIAAEMLGTLNKWLKEFNELDESSKKLVLTLLAVSAASGPLLLGFSNIINATSVVAPLIKTKMTPAVVSLGETAYLTALEIGALNLALGGIAVALPTAAIALGIKKQKEFTAEIEATKDRIKEANKAYNEHISSLNSVTDAEKILLITRDHRAEITRQLADNEKQLADLHKANALWMGGLADGTEELTKQERQLLEVRGLLNASMLESTGYVDNFVTAEQSKSKAMQQSAEIAQETADAEAEAREKAAKRIEESYTSVKSAATDMFSKINTESTDSVNTYIENLKHNIEATKTWGDNLASLTDRKLDKALVENMRNAGVSMAAEVAVLAGATDDQLSELNSLIAEGGITAREAIESIFGAGDSEAIQPEISIDIDALNANATDAAQQAAESMILQFNTAFGESGESISESIGTIANTFAENEMLKESALELGIGTMQSLSDGFSEGQESVTERITSIGEETISTWRTILGSDGTNSFIMEQEGVAIAQGVMLGITNTQPLMVATATETANSIPPAFDAIVPQMQASGVNTGEGWIVGFNSKVPDMVSSAVSAANQINAAFNATLDIHSPAGTTKRSAHWYGEGWIEQMKITAVKMADATSGAANMVSNAFDSGLYFDNVGTMVGENTLKNMQSFGQSNVNNSNVTNNNQRTQNFNNSININGDYDGNIERKMNRFMQQQTRLVYQ